MPSRPNPNDDTGGAAALRETAARAFSPSDHPFHSTGGPQPAAESVVPPLPSGGKEHSSLTQYLRRGIAAGVTHFTLSAHIHHKTKDVNFYIHPASVSGETEDFVVSEDPFNEAFDFIYNRKHAWTDAEMENKVRELTTMLGAQRGAAGSTAGESED